MNKERRIMNNEVKDAMGEQKAYRERPAASKVEPGRGSGQSGAKAYFFEGDFLECGFIAKASEAVKNFNAGKFALGIEIGGNSLIKLFSCYGRILKTYIKGIHFGVIGNMHLSSLLKIIDIDRYYHYFALFFGGSSALQKTSFSVLTEPNRFIRKRVIHKSKYISMVGESQQEKLGIQKTLYLRFKFI